MKQNSLFSKLSCLPLRSEHQVRFPQDIARIEFDIIHSSELQQTGDCGWESWTFHNSQIQTVEFWNQTQDILCKNKIRYHNNQ